jgi:hypothetical protein
MRTLGYLLPMFVVTVAALVRLRRVRARGARRLFAEGMLLLLAILVAAELCALLWAPTGDPDDHHFFLHVRLLAYGLFGVVPLYLAGVAAIAWRHARGISLLAAVGAATVLTVALDAFVVEPRWLEVSHVRVQSAKVTRPLTIVVLADIQTDEVGDWEKSVLLRAMAEQPDLLLLPGDYVHVERDRARWEAQVERLRALLVETGVRARLGAFAVQGNVDFPGWEAIFRGTGIEASSETTTTEVEGVTLTALGFRDSFDRQLRVAARPSLHIAFGHGPDFALGDVQADLLIAGHTHGGQVQLPFLGPLVTLSAVPRAWASGVTELSGGRTLVVSRGIGMERADAPRLRFLCRPEVVVIRVEPG